MSTPLAHGAKLLGVVTEKKIGNVGLLKLVYFALAQKMLSQGAKETSFYSVFGTHDEEMIKKTYTLLTLKAGNEMAMDLSFPLG